MTEQASETQDDEALLDAWATGDRTCGDVLVRRHFMAVYRFFFNKSPDHVDDLTQRTFEACVGARRTFQPGRPFVPYLLGIARNVLLMHFRSQRVRGTPVDFAEMTIEGLLTSPSGVVADREEERLLLLALRRLPVDLQTALELAYWEDLRVVEIADVLSIPVGTVKSRLIRARRLLKEAVAELAESREAGQSTIGNLEQWAQAIRARHR